LFVPGDRPERFERAAQAADVAILDLEDAVADDDKDVARSVVRNWLIAGGNAIVRVNAFGTPWHADDIAALAELPTLAGVVLPKAESAEQGEAVRDGLSGETPIIALVESAAGIEAVSKIARTRAVDRIAFGSIDYALDVQADESFESLLWARSAIVNASRAAGLTGPIDGVTAVLDQPGLAGVDARRSRALGFEAKLCIHPKQVPEVSASFQPTAEEIAWATEVLDADASGACVVGGSMVDRPVLERARRILKTTGSGANYQANHSIRSHQ
jgi:citrate lyase subunit beta/citryl-CoA lyase